MLKNKNYILSFFLLLTLFMFSCGTPVPEKEIATAKKEIQRAENAQANDLDRENLEEAKTELQAAEKLVKDKKNEEATKKVLNSIVKARFAVKNSKSKLLKSKLDKIKELIAEAKRYHAHKISAVKFKSGVSKYEAAKKSKATIDTNAKLLTEKLLKTGDVVAKYENYIKDSDKGITLATQAANDLESALVDSKARIHKLEKNIAETTNLLNRLQKDRVIAKNFKDKLTEIRQKLNEANEYYKKFKFTDDTTQALEHLTKAEQLAEQAYGSANQLNTEGRAKLQALYKDKAKKALTEAQNQVSEAEKLYQNRKRPVGTRRNPYIPKSYKKINNKASQKLIAQSDTAEEPNAENSSSPSEAKKKSENSKNSSTQEPGTGEAKPAASKPETKPESTTENKPANTEETTKKKKASDVDIERELEQDGKKEKNLSIEEMYKRMKEKLKSADEKYKKGDYVGSWEDAEEAKMLAAKIKEKTKSNSGTAINSGNSQKKLEIWKYYIVRYRRKNTDCLWRIALKLYRDATLWPMIWYANKLKIADPDVIFPRQKLAIPKVNANRRK